MKIHSSPAHEERLAAARNGILPCPPDFTAMTHQWYRKRLVEMFNAVTHSDVKALKAIPLPPRQSGTPLMLWRYREAAIIALQARQAGQAKQSKAA